MSFSVLSPLRTKNYSEELWRWLKPDSETFLLFFSETDPAQVLGSLRRSSLLGFLLPQSYLFSSVRRAYALDHRSQSEFFQNSDWEKSHLLFGIGGGFVIRRVELRLLVLRGSGFTQFFFSFLFRLVSVSFFGIRLISFFFHGHLQSVGKKT